MESSPEPEYFRSRILDIIDEPSGTVSFTISSTATSEDFMATMAYLDSDQSAINNQLDAMLEHAINIGMINNRLELIDNSSESINSQAIIKKALVFGDNPSYADVKAAFMSVYGESSFNKQMRLMLLSLIDEAKFAGTKVIANSYNEITTANHYDVEIEMGEMTDKVKSDDSFFDQEA